MIIEELYFALPIYFANMMPVFVKNINILNYPINKNIFGENKTIRGFLSAIFISIIIFYVQYYLYKFYLIKKISLINYYEVNLLFLGFLAGFGAMLGDLIKSYFKRIRNIKPGHSWIPFDQLDFIFGSLLFLYPFVNLTAINVLTLLIFTPLLHIAANFIGYYIGLKDKKW